MNLFDIKCDFCDENAEVFDGDNNLCDKHATLKEELSESSSVQ